MATWEDGPEYAPVERPAEFDRAEAPALDVAEPYRQPAAGAPVERPQFSGPQDDLSPLDQLVPADQEEHRDPNRPFDVASATMTEASSAPSAWTSARGSAAGAGWGPPAGLPASTGFPPPTVDYPPGSQPAPVWPGPSDPIRFDHGPAAGQNGFPSPGTVGWFAPGAPVPTRENVPPDARALAQAVTPPVIILLLLTIIYPLSPIFFAIAWGLSSRIRVARREVLRSFGVATAAIVVFFLFFLAIDDGTTSGYTIFTLCTMVFSLAELVTAFVLVRRGFTRPSGPAQYPPPPSSPWG